MSALYHSLQRCIYDVSQSYITRDRTGVMYLVHDRRDRPTWTYKRFSGSGL